MKKHKPKNCDKSDQMERSQAARLAISDNDSEQKFAAFMSVFHGKTMTRTEVRQLREK